MPGLSDTFEPKLLDAFAGNLYASTAGIPATLYVALFNVAPTDTTFGTEVSGTGYARVAMAQNATNWPAASAANGKRNGIDVVFPTATGNWTTANAWALLDHATNSAAANIVCVGAALNPAVTVLSGVTPRILINALQVLLD